MMGERYQVRSKNKKKKGIIAFILLMVVAGYFLWPKLNRFIIQKFGSKKGEFGTIALQKSQQSDLEQKLWEEIKKNKDAVSPQIELVRLWQNSLPVRGEDWLIFFIQQQINSKETTQTISKMQEKLDLAEMFLSRLIARMELGEIPWQLDIFLLHWQNYLVRSSFHSIVILDRMQNLLQNEKIKWSDLDTSIPVFLGPEKGAILQAYPLILFAALQSGNDKMVMELMDRLLIQEKKNEKKGGTDPEKKEGNKGTKQKALPQLLAALASSYKGGLNRGNLNQTEVLIREYLSHFSELSNEDKLTQWVYLWAVDLLIQQQKYKQAQSQLDILIQKGFSWPGMEWVRAKLHKAQSGHNSTNKIKK